MKMNNKYLIIGYGNPGRLDDGLGPAFAEAIEEMHFPNVTVESNYQLNVEDSSDIAKHNVVIFADATVDGQEPFYFKEINPRKETSFSSHTISPEAVLGFAHDLFKTKTKGYVLGIRGYNFNEFGQILSDDAKINLHEAIKFISSKITGQELI